MGKRTQTAAVSIDEDRELAALLASDDDLDDTEAEEMASVANDDDLEDAITSLEIDEEVKAAQAEDVAEAEDEIPEDDTVVATPKAARVTGTRVASGSKPSEALTARLGSSLYDSLTLTSGIAAMDEGVRKSYIEDMLRSFDALPKKVGEKVVNAVTSVSSGVTLSVYTREAISLLMETGEMTTEALRKRYLARPYTPGTANAQSSQMFRLLPALGIAEKSGKSLVLNKDSLLIPFFQKAA